MDKASLYPDLEEIAAKSSYKQIFDIFYRLAQVRYATHKQLQAINHRVATKPNLVKFISAGYLESIDLVKACKITPKTLKILEREGYNVTVLTEDLRGKTLQHALKVTNVILKLQGEEHFYNLFHPVFGHPPNYNGRMLTPDFCVVWKNGGACKIQFGEVEEEKPEWEEHLLGKRANYERIASDKNTYNLWWKVWSEKLGLTLCDEASFCFSVVCYSSKKLDYDWRGWCFLNG